MGLISTKMPHLVFCFSSIPIEVGPFPVEVEKCFVDQEPTSSHLFFVGLFRWEIDDSLFHGCVSLVDSGFNGSSSFSPIEVVSLECFLCSAQLTLKLKVI